MDENTKRMNDAYDYLLYKHLVTGHESLANALKTSRPNVTAMLNGRCNVTISTLKKLCDAFPGVFNQNYLLNGEGELLAVHGASPDEEPGSLDQGSLINAALAAKDETIRSKDEMIAVLQEQIAHLKSEVEFLRRSFQTSHMQTTFQIGVAEDDEKPSFYTPAFPQSPK